MKAREIIGIIERDGWVVVRSKGSHRIHRHPTKPGQVTIAVHPGDIPIGTMRAILKQAGITHTGGQ